MRWRHASAVIQPVARIRAAATSTLRVVGATGIAVVIGLGAVDTAMAAGGSTIATAPTIPSGSQQLGDTALGERFWRVALDIGDVLSVTWSNTEAPSASTELLCLARPEETDPAYSRFDDRLTTSTIPTGGGGTLVYTATRPGNYILDFQCASSSATQTYTFTPTVTSYARTGAEVIGANLIATAPTVPLGIKLFGNSLDGQRFWRVALDIGDVLSVTWTNTDAPSALTDLLCLARPDETDPGYSRFDDRLTTSTIATGASGTLVYTATRPGNYVLDFQCASSSGTQTYTFSAAVTGYSRTGAEVVGAGLIATAPTVPLGVKQFGNTLDGQRFWRVALAPGDALVVTWTNTEASSSTTESLCFVGPDETDPDYNRFDDRLATSTIARGSSGVLAYTATRPGNYVLDFQCSSSSSTQTYTFTAGQAAATVTAITKLTTGKKRKLGLTATVSSSAGTPTGRCDLNARIRKQVIKLATRTAKAGKCVFAGVKVNVGGPAVGVFVSFTGDAGWKSSVSRKSTARFT